MLSSLAVTWRRDGWGLERWPVVTHGFFFYEIPAFGAPRDKQRWSLGGKHAVGAQQKRAQGPGFTVGRGAHPLMESKLWGFTAPIAAAGSPFAIRDLSGFHKAVSR